MRSLLTRSLVALVAIPVLLWLMHRGSWWLDSLMAVLILAAGYEIEQLAEKSGVHFSPVVSTAFALTCALVVWSGVESAWAIWLVGLVVATALVSLPRRSVEESAQAFAFQCMAAIWLGVGFGALGALRRLAPGDGFVWLVFLFANLWVGDTSAYLFGRWLGKRPLASTISPKKTIAGGVAQVIVSGLVGGVFVWRGWIDAPGTLIVTAALMIGIVGQLGDLFESVFKRVAGVKDSSSIIPGHGGVLDRFDSALFATPSLWVMIQIWPR